MQWVYVYSDEDQKGRWWVSSTAHLSCTSTPRHLGCYLTHCSRVLPDSRPDSPGTANESEFASIARFKGGPRGRPSPEAVKIAIWIAICVVDRQEILFGAILFCGTQDCRISSRSALCGRVSLRRILFQPALPLSHGRQWALTTLCNYRHRLYLHSFCTPDKCDDTCASHFDPKIARCPVCRSRHLDGFTLAHLYINPFTCIRSPPA